MAETTQNRLSAPARLLIRAILNILLVWALSTYLSDYFHVGGGIAAYIIIGALLTLLNIFIRPVLALLTFPLKLFATLIALIIVNGGFLWLVYAITQLMDGQLVTLDIKGVLGWVIVSVAFGLGNWLMKAALK